MVIELRSGQVSAKKAVADQALVRSRKQPVDDPSLADVVEDLRELRYLISDLQATATDSLSEARLLDAQVDGHPNIAPYNPSKRWIQSTFNRSVDMLELRRKRNFDLVERSARWTDRDELSRLLDLTRKDFLALKSALRTAYRQRGTLLCISDWQTPIYASTVPLGMNRLMTGIDEHKLDYKRDGHLDAVIYEEQFVKAFCHHLGSQQLQGYLANCGMAAFNSIIHWLAGEQNLSTASVLAVQPMYFENIHLAKRFFPNLVAFESTSGDDLLANLQKYQPSVVLCDAVTNCGQVTWHNLETIVAWAAHQAEHPVSLVLDTTCYPTMYLPAGLLADLPEHVTVIFIESLAKYHQFGLDTVTGGIAVMHASAAQHSSFSKTRARVGANIADGSVASLPRPNQQALDSRLRRHCRNTTLLIDKLQNHIKGNNNTVGIMASLSWLQTGVAENSWYTGTCFSIHMHERFRSVANYQEFERRVMELALSENCPLALSTSFGFDVTRLYVTAPNTPFEPPFLRVSVGTDTTCEIAGLADIMIRVSHELALKWDNELANKRSPKLQASAPTQPAAQLPATLPPPLNTSRTGIPESVFTGPDSLKDYLCPANYAPTPLVELPNDLNPYRQRGVRIFAKMMPLVPLMNIKSVPAFSMLEKAEERGQLAGVTNIIESSSSNTVLSLSVIAKVFGVDTTCAIVDHSIAPALLRMLRLFGIEAYVHPGPGHELFADFEPRSQRAARQGSQPGWLNPGQYTNPDNPDGFGRWLAPDLWAQTQGHLNVLSCGLGTCGTMVGVSRALRERNPELIVIANCPQPGQAVPGPRERMQLSDVSFPWQDVANHAYELTSQESFDASIKLLRRGILGGPSSGMNYAGLLSYIGKLEQEGNLQSAVQAQGELWCTFLCCDSPLPHVDEYYDALGDKYFPPVHDIPRN